MLEIGSNIPRLAVIACDRTPFPAFEKPNAPLRHRDPASKDCHVMGQSRLMMLARAMLRNWIAVHQVTIRCSLSILN